MSGGIDWFRWHHGTVSDQKFQLVAKKAGASVAEVLAVWACLLESASSSVDRGSFGEPDFDVLDCALGLVDGKAKAIFEQMSERGLVELDRVSAWDRRQAKRERDDQTSTDRVRAFRERKRQETPIGNDETPRNANETSETPRGEESREEKKEDSSLRSESARATRLPADWRPDDELYAWARSQRPELDVELVIAAFRDYWRGVGGQKGRKLDWPATFRNWVRNERAPALPSSRTAKRANTLAELTGNHRAQEVSHAVGDIIDI